MKFIPRFIVPLILLPMLSFAQEFSGGFRAGLNFSTLSGDRESGVLPGDDAATTLERLNRTTGFHVGATFAYEITDLVGLKADLMYSQKGGQIVYEGPSYLYLYLPDTEEQRFPAPLSSELDVINSYIDIPLVGYYRIGPLEIEGGVTTSLLVNSRASGSAEYQGVDVGGTIGERDIIAFNYDYNYFDDFIGGDAIVDLAEQQDLGNFLVPSVTNAYYNAESSEPVYRRFDFGLIGGLAVYLNNGLYLGARYQYGLTDVTRGENDLRVFALASDNDREYNTDDKDYNRVLQASVGFRF